jgi:hypothetical protein
MVAGEKGRSKRRTMVSEPTGVAESTYSLTMRLRSLARRSVSIISYLISTLTPRVLTQSDFAADAGQNAL